jgi:large subunit ribosomal protein LX
LEASLSEVKKFRITGEIRKAKLRIPFVVEYAAMKQEHAMQRLYAEMGSRHRARRFEIKVTNVREAKEEPAQAKA